MSALARREFIINGSAALAALAVFQSRFAWAFPSREGETVIAWLDQPAENPVPEIIKTQLVWEDLDSWVTPNDKFFSIAHFDRPVIDANSWKLEIDGLVEKPMALTLADLKARPSQKVTFTVECSGNHGFPFFTGGIGNAQWTGTPLAALLEEAGVKENGIEVVFWGTDVGDVELKERNVKMHQNFARSMTLAEAMNSNNILCYEMNGAALPAPNGFPLRLIAPGWYGIANVKWLKRIEVRDRPFRNQFMARDYVTIREEDHNGETVWAETCRRPRPVEVSARAGHTERQQLPDYWCGLGRADRQGGGQDRRRTMAGGGDRSQRRGGIRLEDLASRLGKPAPGEHTVTSRATDASGQIQPAMDDPWITKKKTYWESNGQVTRRVKIT